MERHDGDRATLTSAPAHPPKNVYAFEEGDDTLPYVTLAARRALDVAGAKLSLDGWLSLPRADREALIAAGAAERVDADAVRAAIARARPAPTPLSPRADPPAGAPEPALLAALGTSRPLPAARWAALRPVDRYALVKLAGKPEKLALAYDAIVRGRPVLTHLDAAGAARMVDVAPKVPTARCAVASARVRLSPAVLDLIAAGEVPKGDVFAVARVAGIQAAKRTPDLIPLCHTVALTRVEVSFTVDRALGAVRIRARAEATDRTGVEMEALTAASVAALTLYDMTKAVDRWATITDLQLEEKSGGKSGDVSRPKEEST